MGFINFGCKLIFSPPFLPVGKSCYSGLSASTEWLFRCFCWRHKDLNGLGCVFYGMLRCWFRAPVCVHSTHLDSTPSHGTGLEFCLLLDDHLFILLFGQTKKPKVDIKIPCRFHWLMDEVFLVAFSGTRNPPSHWALWRGFNSSFQIYAHLRPALLCRVQRWKPVHSPWGLYAGIKILASAFYSFWVWVSLLFF